MIAVRGRRARPAAPISRVHKEAARRCRRHPRAGQRPYVRFWHGAHAVFKKLTERCREHRKDRWTIFHHDIWQTTTLGTHSTR